MRFLELAYEAALTAARPAMELGARSVKAKRALSGRRQSIDRFRRWARRQRDIRMPLIWVHAPSVGEALMASAIIRELRERADVQVAFTMFSPSAERVAERIGADVHAYLPWDVRSDVREALSILEPGVIAFVRTEIWPTLVRESKERRARAVLLNAPLAPTSSRLRPLARWALSPAYSRLDAVGVVSEDDLLRFERLGVHRDRMQVAGDARFDQVLERVGRIDRDMPLLRVLGSDPRPVLVAGSTWPEDEDLLIAAWPALQASDVRLIIAPHEPTPEHLDRLGGALDRAGIRHVGLADAEAAGRTADVTVIDRVGILADVYAVGQWAWVGGGFGTSGLHSVIEPAALGLPVMFGPRPGNAREAAELVAAGGGASVTTAVELSEVMARWSNDPAPGLAAREFVASRAGGAERNARIILDFIPGAKAQAGRSGD